MKHAACSLLACLALCLLAPGVTHAQAALAKTVEFDSPSVGRKMKYQIVLPARYDKSDERFPVLYLLHGFSSNYTAWSRMGAGSQAQHLDLIIVIPDAGNSWYVNWAASEEGQKNRWEDAIIKDLIGHIDSTYRTIARREGRAINGLSMGGYGGLTLGLRHPDKFCAIGSHSGAIAFAKQFGERLKSGAELPRANRTPTTTPNPAIGIEGFNSQAERSPKGKIFTSVEECAAHDPFQLVLKVPREKLPHIYIDCGTEDRLIEANQAFLKLLMENKIPFTYAQSEGGHVGAYWAREVGHSIAVQHAIMRRSLAAAKAATANEKTAKP